MSEEVRFVTPESSTGLARMRHNCTKESDFDTTYLGGIEGSKGSFLDRIRCNICQREYIEIRKHIKVVRKADGFVEYDSEKGGC